MNIAEFTLGGQHYRGLEAGPPDPLNRAFSIMVIYEDQAECEDHTDREDQVGIDRLWNALGEGGVPGNCGWLTDQWGMSWQIVTKTPGELLAAAFNRKAGRQGHAKVPALKIAGLPGAAHGR